jgi:DNA-nicking Smr family endonuclease
MNKNKDNDNNLFRAAMLDVQTYEHEGAEPFRQKRPAKPLPLNQQQDKGEDLADLAADVPEFFEFRRPGIQHRVYQDLQRGLIPPEDSLDLHGMRVADARQAFARFFTASLQRRLRCIRIIHGKGRGSADQQPVLKQKTYHWLLQKKAVLAFVTAPRWDGGSGACYALLSRKRN